jgi:hypothetical protein
MDQTAILLTSMTTAFVSWAIIANFWIIPWLKENPSEMGATYFIPILAVPPLFVSHLLIFWVLIAGNRHKNT